MDHIQFIGQEDFSVDEMRIITEIAHKEFTKLQRMVDNPTITIKMQKHGKILGILNKKVRYSFHLKVSSTDLLVSASEAEWNLSKSLHGVFDNAMSEIQKKVKKEKKPWISNK